MTIHFEDIEKYFIQQKEKYGPVLYLDDPFLFDQVNHEKNKITDMKQTAKPSTANDVKGNYNISVNTNQSKTAGKVKKPEILKIEAENADDDLFHGNTEWKKSTSLEDLYSKIHNCINCSLGETRKNFVFGTGNPDADIMFIGEAPGADEDLQGKPFVGRAGQLLTKLIEQIGMKREDVFIANIIKCRPPENRVPLPTEIIECKPYLIRQIELIKPAIIVALGLSAIDSLLNIKHKMADTRGKVMYYHEHVKLLVTYHPAAILRNPNLRRVIDDDFLLLKKLHEEMISKSN
jgi:DNA polymerase